MDPLLDAIRRHADRQPAGVPAATAIPGLATVRATRPSDLTHDILRPMVCLVRQGAKRVSVGVHHHDFAAGDSLLITADVPTTSRITDATAGAPYYSLALELDAAVIADLIAQMDAPPSGPQVAVRVDPTEADVADAALRLVNLLDRPASRAVLQAQAVRELHYWLLAGRHGDAIRELGWPGGHVQRIARAVKVLRREYADPLPVERLAAEAGMSPSAFHQHFKRVTSLSPLQFQKRLRLIEARRLMQAQGASAGSAAHAVGYGSVPQFTREYGRMFGLSPVADARAARVLHDGVHAAPRGR